MVIILYHSNNKIAEAVTTEHQKIVFDEKLTPVQGLHQLARQFPDHIMVWCDMKYKAYLNLKEIGKLFHHQKLMLSFNPATDHFLPKAIGYVEDSVCIPVSKKVSYPSWQMNSVVGGIPASVLLAIKEEIPLDVDFDYYLNSLAKMAMPLGLCCYSEPKLLTENQDLGAPKSAVFTLFKFVKQHYKTRWLFLLALDLMLYDGKFPLFPFLYALLFRKRKLSASSLEKMEVKSVKKVIDKKTIDVIIPTIGRKQYLYDVLCDLRNQTHLPLNVIIVEQNPDKGSVSELHYLKTESWPFAIRHIFTHQAGACNARNLALDELSSEWVFLADDDIRIAEDLISGVLDFIKKNGVKAVSVSCKQTEEKSDYRKQQWGSFGSGCSFIKSEIAKNCKFNSSYEFGYGEDADFGMQLRNQGIDIIYVPEPQIVHLKAPIGGFRTKPVLQWQHDEIQPKPAPTVMLYQLMHKTREQRLGYKTTLFFKFYPKQPIKNPLLYLSAFRNQWNRSVFWSEQLKKQS